MAKLINYKWFHSNCADNVIDTAMNVTFPTLMQEFAVGMSTVQLITTGYLLALAIVIPASAFLKKRFYGRQIFVTANLIFLKGTLLGFWAPSFGILLFGRILQGAGTGLAHKIAGQEFL